MDVYQFNRTMVQNYMSPLGQDALKDKAKILNEFKEESHNTYYLLLCRDANYYTVILVDENEEEDFGSVVIDCAAHLGLGAIYDVAPTEDKTAMEIWVKIKQDELPVCMYLLNYDAGVCKAR